MAWGDNFDLFPDELPHCDREVDDSPNGKAQRDKLLAALQLGPVNTIEAREKLGIMHPGGRVRDLCIKGYEISATYLTVVDSLGITRRGVAHYRLISSPVTDPSPQPADALLGSGGGAGDE